MELAVSGSRRCLDELRCAHAVASFGGDDVNRFAGAHTLMPFVSRLTSPNARLRAGLRSRGARFISALAAAAMLFVAPASAQLEHDVTVTSPGSAPTASFLALHSVSSHRLTLEARSRWSPSVGGALPARATAIAVAAIAHASAVDASPESFSASVAARGYDAIAPPALS